MNTYPETKETLCEMRERFLQRLRKRIKDEFNFWQRREIYKHGMWTGVLDALNSNSPHCVQSVKEAKEWYLYGLQYIRWCEMRYRKTAFEAEYELQESPLE